MSLKKESCMWSCACVNKLCANMNVSVYIFVCKVKRDKVYVFVI